MKIGARPLLAMHTNQAFLARVRAAVTSDYTFQALPDWPTLLQVVGEAPASALVIVDPFDEAGPRGLASGLNEITTQYPSIPVVAAVEIRPELSEALVALGSHGIVEVIAIGHDDTRDALRRRLANAQGRPLKALLEEVLPPDLPGTARALLDAAAQIVSRGEHGRDLAVALHLSRRTLLRWTEKSALPPPRKLLAWVRILQAATLLDDPGRTVYSVARACGYASDSGLRRVTMHFLSLSPTDMRRRGAFAAASKAFLKALQKYGTNA